MSKFELQRKFLLLLFLAPQFIFSQNITVSGSVYGYLGEKVLLLRNARKNVSFEGPLNGAQVNITGGNLNTSVLTDITGSYSLTITDKGTYNLLIKHTRYSTVSVKLIYNEAGLKTYFPALSFILKKEDNSQNNLGEVMIDNSGKLVYTSDKLSKKSSSDVLQSNQILLEKSVLINNSSAVNVIDIKPPVAHKVVVESHHAQNEVKLSPMDTVIAKQEIIPAAILSTMLQDTITNVDSLKSYIERYNEILVTLNPGDKNYQLLKARIVNAQKRLRQNEQVIEMQTEQLSVSKKKQLYLTLFSLFAAASGLLLLLVLFQRRKHARVLDEKNKSITRMNDKLTSSIRYASTIQSNFFKDKTWLKRLFKNSFIYNRPQNLLSGDFYWFAHVNNHKIAVVADCTGHGVPGALLTMLGHNLLEEIVSVRGETQPERILDQLSHSIISAFSRGEDLEYGMDVTVLSIKDGSNEASFSGITNGIYVFSNGQLNYYPVTPKTIGPDILPGDVKDQVVKIKSGDCFFMLSDGFCDQFGEQTGEIEKYNLPRLEELLKKIATEKSFNDSEEILKTEFETWKGAREQVDDVLVLGIKID